MKALYLYAGARKNKFAGEICVDYPDTPFYGLNHLEKFGINAEVREFDDLIKNPLLNKLFGFRLKHLLLCFYARKYDIVFGPSILYTAILKRLICPKTKFILLDINTTRTIEANKHKRFKYALIRRLLNEMDGIACLSRVQINFLRNISPRIADRLFYVPLGVDTVFHKPNYHNRMDYVLAVGRDNGRDYKTVIGVSKLMPEQEFQIVCSARNITGIQEIPKNVSIKFDLSANELKQKYEEAKALLLITHRDNHIDGADCSGQTVLLDAMASGLPVIASRKKYLQDYVADREEAILVDFYNCEEIKAGIESLNNVELAMRIAMRARQKIEAEFSTEKMAGNLVEVFTRVLANKNE